MLAKFGEMALRSDNLQEVLDEACRLVVAALDIDLSKILEVEPGGQSLLVRAGVGWGPGIVGETRLQMNERSSETYAITLAEPVITPDIHTEDRFTLPSFLVDQGVRALVNVPIFVSRNEPAYGLLQVDSRTPREFGDLDIEFLRTYASILGPVIDRLHKKRDLAQALDDNRQLLAELQHRVKNHLGVITSLVAMRARGATLDETRSELRIVGDRIETLRLAHEHIYAGGNAQSLALGPYMATLLKHLCDLNRNDGSPVELDIECDDIEIGPDDAVPLGLIINEFATNSFKYAFGPTGGQIIFRAEQRPDHRICVQVSGNGPGLPAVRAPAKLGSGTGMRLIAGLARQLRAEVKWSSKSGTGLSLMFADRRRDSAIKQ